MSNNIKVQRVYQDESGKFMVEMGYYYPEVAELGGGIPKRKLIEVEQRELKDVLSQLFEDSNRNSSILKSLKQNVVNLLRKM